MVAANRSPPKCEHSHVKSGYAVAIDLHALRPRTAQHWSCLPCAQTATSGSVRAVPSEPSSAMSRYSRGSLTSPPYSTSLPTSACAMNQRHLGGLERRPCFRIAAMRIFSVSTRRTMARPSSGSMTAGDRRNAECPQPPGNSSNTQDEPAEAVPYIGSPRASDWSLQGALLATVIRCPVEPWPLQPRSLEPRPLEAADGSTLSRRHGRDQASFPRRP